METLTQPLKRCLLQRLLHVASVSGEGGRAVWKEVRLVFRVTRSCCVDREGAALWPASIPREVLVMLWNHSLGGSFSVSKMGILPCKLKGMWKEKCSWHTRQMSAGISLMIFNVM